VIHQAQFLCFHPADSVAGHTDFQSFRDTHGASGCSGVVSGISLLVVTGDERRE
jgi:hypothetical protein